MSRTTGTTGTTDATGTKRTRKTTGRRTAVRACLSAVCALLAGGTVPAQAAPQEEFPGNWLYVTVTRGDAHFGDTRGRLLLCDPPRRHVHAAPACEDLRAAGGDPTRIPREEGYCPMVHAPVTASARGMWHGRPVAYRKTFSNACVMAAETGRVFAPPA